MECFIKDLKKKMLDELDAISLDGNGLKDRCILSLRSINNHLLKLKTFIASYSFTSDEEEIRYYKHLVPPLHAEYVYYTRLLDIETRIPETARKSYYSKETKELKLFLRRNNALYQYYKMDAAALDKQFYSNQPVEEELALDECFPVVDTHYITVKGLRVAQFIAYERLLKFLIKQISVQDDNRAALSDTSHLKWTESKMSLIELLYALFYCGCFNRGHVEIRELAQLFEQMFHINLGNYYRSKQDMYMRKSSVVFLDTLRNSLQKGLEESDGQ